MGPVGDFLERNVGRCFVVCFQVTKNRKSLQKILQPTQLNLTCCGQKNTRVGGDPFNATILGSTSWHVIWLPKQFWDYNIYIYIWYLYIHTYNIYIYIQMRSNFLFSPTVFGFFGTIFDLRILEEQKASMFKMSCIISNRFWVVKLRTFFIFTLKTLGFHDPIWRASIFFQLGWFNQQLGLQETRGLLPHCEWTDMLLPGVIQSMVAIAATWMSSDFGQESYFWLL